MKPGEFTTRADVSWSGNYGSNWVTKSHRGKSKQNRLTEGSNKKMEMKTIFFAINLAWKRIIANRELLKGLKELSRAEIFNN